MRSVLSFIVVRLLVYGSLYQWARFQRFESQPLISVPRSRFETADALPRQRKGTTTTCWVRRSFIRTKCAARLTGSISVSAARNSRSYSSLRQRVELRPAHLFSFWAISQDTKGSMNRWGSGEPLLKLYICRPAEKLDDVSRFARAVEKNTAGTIGFTSSSIPGLPAPCLTSAW